VGQQQYLREEGVEAWREGRSFQGHVHKGGGGCCCGCGGGGGLLESSSI
jgi:hypothetical protein